MGVRFPAQSGGPPRLVLRFAVFTGLALLVAGALMLFVARHSAEVRARSDARSWARMVVDHELVTVLRPSDFLRPVDARRREVLDRFFRRHVLVDDVLRVKVYSPDGVVTYSNDHSLIGTTPGGGEMSIAAGETAATIARLNDEGGSGPDRKVLEIHVPVELRGRQVGVAELYRDYGPVGAATRAFFVPIAIGVALVLLGLYVALFPILRGVTRRLRREMELVEHQAFHDGLTDLPNRLLFQDHVEQAVLGCRHKPCGFTVMMIDLDRFKDVNDSLGHAIGDRLLTAIGGRLRGRLREGDTVARLGGDEFAVLAMGVSTSRAALSLAQELRGILAEPFAVDDLEIAIDASVGIAIFPEHGTGADELLRHADLAMYAAKESRLETALYEQGRGEESLEALRLVADLRRALTDGEGLVIHYQPKVELDSGEVRSVEALVRWQHPERGLLGPDEFVPLAQGTGLIRKLTRFVLDAALRQCRTWHDAGQTLGVAVNLSECDLSDLALPADVERFLAKWGIEPHRLELEVTEDTILRDPLRTREILGRLKALGVTLAIDDYGSGNSSLGLLKNLPLDVIKIDKSFVTNMEADPDNAAIVRTTIDLGHSLGLRIIAEGVEDDGVRRALANLACEAAQGFYFSQPIPGERLPTRIADLHRAADDDPSENAASKPPKKAAA